LEECERNQLPNLWCVSDLFLFLSERKPSTNTCGISVMTYIFVIIVSGYVDTSMLYSNNHGDFCTCL
jgi:hypothetical protein